MEGSGDVGDDCQSLPITVHGGGDIYFKNVNATTLEQNSFAVSCQMVCFPPPSPHRPQDFLHLCALEVKHREAQSSNSS